MPKEWSCSWMAPMAAEACRSFKQHRGPTESTATKVPTSTSPYCVVSSSLRFKITRTVVAVPLWAVFRFTVYVAVNPA